jgi:Uri superfamily endonuclease
MIKYHRRSADDRVWLPCRVARMDAGQNRPRRERSRHRRSPGAPIRRYAAPRTCHGGINMSTSPVVRVAGITELGFGPEFDWWPDAGVYVVWFRLTTGQRITVGRLGRFTFGEGRYAYTGRASRGLRARVRRHITGRGRRHWHIDYLLAAPHVRFDRVVLASIDAEMECVVNRAVGRDAVCVAPGFGATDCRRGCPTHLWWYGSDGLRGGSASGRYVPTTAPSPG